MSQLHSHRLLSPPVLPRNKFKSEVHSPDSYLSELQANAQQSIHRHIKQPSISHDIPSCNNIHRRSNKQLHKPTVTLRTKQPSLPYLKGNQFYNKWYIPYDQRYIKKQKLVTSKEEDENHFYNNLYDIRYQVDPFQSQLPLDVQRSLEHSHRHEAMKEILRGTKIIQEFKKQLEKSSQRVPAFIKNIIDEK